MGLFSALLINIRDVIYPDIVAKYNTLMGLNPAGLDGKVDKVTGKGLSTEDYTTLEKNKLSLIDMGLVEMLEHKGFPNGYVPLDANGKISPQYLGSLNIVDTYFPADQASMLALSQAGIGDIAFIPNVGNGGFDVFVLASYPASTLANWKSMYLVGVTSINGQVGVVNIGTDDIPEGLVNQYFTNERVDDRVAALVQAGLNITLTYDDVAGTFTISGIDAYTKTQTDTNIAAAISALVAASPTALDTLNELAAALGNDANFATTMTTLIGTKAPTASPVFTGSIGLPQWTTAARPILGIGDRATGFNTDIGTQETWNGTAWISSSDIAAQIHAATAKATPIDADEFGFWDSVSGVFRKLSFANLYATLKARFDLVYMNLLLLMTISTGVRQTIQFSSVDTNGLPNFAVAGALLSLDISASPSVPVKIHAAGGDTDRLVKLLTNMTISGLAANALNYCYFDVASDGTVTGGSTVVSPEYINGTPNIAFPTWDSTTKGSGVDLTNGNLTATKNGTAWLNSTVYSTKKVKSGKFYAEVTVGTTSAGYIHVGVSANNTYQADAVGSSSVGYSYRNDVSKVSNGTPAAYGAAYTTGDIIGVLYDAMTGQIIFYKNNVSQGVAFTVTPYTPMHLAVSQYAVSNTSTINYGASAFNYSLPLGYSAWNEEILNGKFTFSIAEMKAYVGNGLAAPQAFRVFFAEATTNATNVTSVVNYALNGVYTSGRFAIAANNVYSKNHNLGVVPSIVKTLQATLVGGALAEPNQFNEITAYRGSPIISIANKSFALSCQGSMPISTGVATQAPAVEAIMYAQRGW